MKKLYIQFSTTGFIFIVDQKTCQLLSSVTLNEKDPVLNSICKELEIDIKEMMNTLHTFNKFFPTMD